MRKLFPGRFIPWNGASARGRIREYVGGESRDLWQWPAPPDWIRDLAHREVRK